MVVVANRNDSSRCSLIWSLHIILQATKQFKACMHWVLFWNDINYLGGALGVTDVTTSSWPSFVTNMHLIFCRQVRANSMFFMFFYF